MKNLKKFLNDKDIKFTAQRYFHEGLSAMALGLFASLLIGIIFKTIGEELTVFFGNNKIFEFLIELGKLSMSLMGAAVGVSVSWGLKAPPLVVFSGLITGTAGAIAGGPAGAFIAAVAGAEFGKAISKETKVDIIVTPGVTLVVGMIVANMASPVVGNLMKGLGVVVTTATELRPFLMGVTVAIIVGIVLTAPISSAALCIMLDLSGLAAGAATAGCAAQMIGFAVISYRVNGVGGFVAQGLGTSMLQISNIIKNPWIIIPPTFAGAVVGALSTTLFKMENIAIGAGMGTSGLVGQIGTFKAMGFTGSVLLKVALLHFIIPAAVAIAINIILKRFGKIKNEDYKIKMS